MSTQAVAMSDACPAAVKAFFERPTPEPGMHYSVPFREYAGWGAINQSWAKLFWFATPAHAMHDLEAAKESEDLTIGRAVHALALEPVTFPDEFLIAPKVDRRTKEGKAMWAEIELVAKGRTILKEDQALQVSAQVAGIHRCAVANRMIRHAQREVSIFWHDPATGLPCKARLDILDFLDNGATVIGDLKTTRDASRSAFARSVAAFGYHFQAGAYSDGLFVADQIDADQFAFILSEKKPPFLANVCFLDRHAVEQGRRQWQGALAKIRECLETGEFPGYPTDLQPVTLPAYAVETILDETENNDDGACIA